MHAGVEGCRHQDFELCQDGGEQGQHHQYHKNNAERNPGLRQEKLWLRDAGGFEQRYVKGRIMDDVLSSLLLE